MRVEKCDATYLLTFSPHLRRRRPPFSLALWLPRTHLLDLCVHFVFRPPCLHNNRTRTHESYMSSALGLPAYMRLTLNYKTKQFYIHFCVCSLCFALTRSYSTCVCLFGAVFISVADNFSVFVHNLFPYGRNLSFGCLHHFYSYDFSVRFQCVCSVSV